MSDTTKTMGVGIKLDRASIERELKEFRTLLMETVKSVGLGSGSIENLTREVNNASAQMKRIKADLVAYQKAQDADLAREEVAMAKRVNAELLAIQKARVAQAVAVNKSLTASGGFNWITGGMNTTARSQMASYYKEQAQEAERLANATKRVSSAHRDGGRVLDAYHSSIINLRGGISGYIKDVQSMILIQARWYGARTALFGATQLPINFIRQGIEYAVLIDTWNAKLLRWGASSGKITEQARRDMTALVMEMRKMVLDIPIPLEKLGEAVEGFIGAGIDPSVVKEMTKQIAALAATYPEIDMEQFGTSIVGFYNSFKDTIKGATSEAEKFKIIMDQMTAAQAKGVIRPEQFQLVMQHLGEAARNAGFTTEQMLAMSVVITDLGSRAGSAARAARGFMDQLSKSSVQEKLKHIGVEFEKNKTLAEQFDRIMTSLRDKLGGGGTMTMGTQTFLTSIMPVERAKAFTAMLKDWDKYKDTIQYIMGSTGGIMAGLEPKLQSISGQWQLLKNTIAELASSSSITAGGLKGLVSTLLEMARGALYAVQPSMATAENIRKLGDSGKIAYDAIRLLKDMVSGLLDVLSPFKDILLSVLKTLVEYRDAIKVAVQLWGSYKLAVIALRNVLVPVIILLYRMYTALKLVTSAEIASGLANLSKLLAGSQLVQLISVFGKLGPAVGAGVVATAGLGYAIYQINKEARDAKEQLAKLADEASKLPDLHLKIRAQIKAGEISKLQTEIDSNPTAWGYIDKVNKLKALKKEYDVIQRDLASRKGYMTYEIPGMYSSKESGDKSKKPYEFPDPAGKQGTYRMELSAAKAQAKALLDIEKSNYDLRFAILSNFHKLGGSTIQEYYQAELDNAEMNHKNRLAILELEIREIENAYSKGMSEGGLTAEKKLALEDKRAADLTRVNADKVKAQNDYFKEVSNLETEFYRKSLQKLIEQAQHEASVLKLKVQGQIDLNQWAVEERQKQNKWLYDNGILSMGQYYRQEATLIRKDLQFKIETLKNDYNEWKSVWEKKVETAYGQQEKLTDLYREQEQKNQELANNMAQATREATSEMAELYRNLKNDINETFFEPMKSGLKEFFDVASDDFMEFRTLALNVLQDVYNAMVEKFVINKVVGGLSNIMSNTIAAIADTGGVSNTATYSSFGSTFSYLKNSSQGNIFSTSSLVPYLNSIVSNPTLFRFAHGVGLMGEEGDEAIMPLTRMRSGNLGVETTGGVSNLNVKIELINQSGQQLSGKQGEAQINAYEIIIPVVIDAYDRNVMGMRSIMGG